MEKHTIVYNSFEHPHNDLVGGKRNGLYEIYSQYSKLPFETQTYVNGIMEGEASYFPRYSPLCNYSKYYVAKYFFSNGKLHGKFTSYYTQELDRIFEEGYFENDFKVGTWITKDINGNITKEVEHYPIFKDRNSFIRKSFKNQLEYEVNYGVVTKYHKDNPKQIWIKKSFTPEQYEYICFYPSGEIQFRTIEKYITVNIEEQKKLYNECNTNKNFVSIDDVISLKHIFVYDEDGIIIEEKLYFKNFLNVMHLKVYDFIKNTIIFVKINIEILLDKTTEPCLICHKNFANFILPCGHACHIECCMPHFHALHCCPICSKDIFSYKISCIPITNRQPLLEDDHEPDSGDYIVVQ
jgi:hypothetical protein